MVLLASYEEFDLLLTGDMEKEGEERMLEQKEGPLIETLLDSVEVLKVSHHGSRTASEIKNALNALSVSVKYFNDKIRPRLVVGLAVKYIVSSRQCGI